MCSSCFLKLSITLQMDNVGPVLKQSNRNAAKCVFTVDLLVKHTFVNQIQGFVCLHRKREVTQVSKTKAGRKNRTTLNKPNLPG